MVDRQSKPVLVGVDVHIEQRQAFIKSTEKKKKKKKKNCYPENLYQAHRGE